MSATHLPPGASSSTATQVAQSQQPVIVATAYPLPTGSRSRNHLSPLAQRRAALQAQSQNGSGSGNAQSSSIGGRTSGKSTFLAGTVVAGSSAAQAGTGAAAAAPISGSTSAPLFSAASSTSSFSSLSYAGAAPTGGVAGGLIESKGPDIVERPRDKTEHAEVAASSLAFLYAEIVSYVQGRVSGIAELEKRLSLMGYKMGQKLLAMTSHRLEMAANGKNPKREVRLLPVLLWVHTHLWKQAFGKAADSLERSTERADEYMISTNVPLFSKSISIPKDMSQLSVEAITAGIVEAALDGLGFPARVTAHSVPTPEFPFRTTILIKLDPAVMAREEALGS